MSDPIAAINAYARSKGVRCEARVSLDGQMIGLFSLDGDIFETASAEAACAHIDMLWMAQLIGEEKG